MLRMLVDFFSGVVRVLAIVAIFGGAVVGFVVGDKFHRREILADFCNMRASRSGAPSSAR